MLTGDKLDKEEEDVDDEEDDNASRLVHGRMKKREDKWLEI
jgi:hypothetical protein